MCRRRPKKDTRDFITPSIQGITSSIVCLNVEAHKFEHKPALISMVQQAQLDGAPMEDPNPHLGFFLKECDTLKLNGVLTDITRL